MIIARAKLDSGEMLILGLSRTNVSRLLNRQPIVIKRETHGPGVPEGWTICLTAGETEVALYEQFKASGWIGPETKIHRDPRLGIEPDR